MHENDDPIDWDHGQLVREVNRLRSLDTYMAMVQRIQDLETEVARLREWNDRAVANCAKRRCSERDERIRDMEDDYELFTWLIHAVVKYDNVYMSRPEPSVQDRGLYGVGLGDPQLNLVEWHYGETLREAIRAAMRSEFP